MTPVFLAFAFLFTVESQPPELPQVRYPEWEQKDDIRRRVDAQLTLQMEITADGAISRVTLVAQENIPAGRRTKPSNRSNASWREAGPSPPCGTNGHRLHLQTHLRLAAVCPPPEQHRYPGTNRGVRWEKAGGAPRRQPSDCGKRKTDLIGAPDGREIPLETFKAELDARARAS